ncbi:MAG: tyrosine-type recombinase/integrase [Marinirhabdus sp.]|nr:tyrosine-type recombinase/integrase [Marinirhabdus sp.]
MDITIDLIEHRGHACYALRFDFNKSLKALIKELSMVKYSVTYRCFYVYVNRWSLEELRGVLEAKGISVDYGTSIKRNSLPNTNTVTPPPLTTRLNPKDQALFDAYVSYLKGLRFSVSTIETYSTFARGFVLFLKGKALTEVTNTDVRLFVEAEIKTRQYSISSHRQLISALKHFATLHLECAIEADELVRPSRSKYLPTVLSKQEVIDLLRATKNLKHRAALALLYSSGLRIGELISLRLHRIDIDRRQLFVKNSKGRKDRVVVLAESFIPLFKNYYVTYRPETYFIESPKGGPYNPGSVRQFLKRSCQLAGIKKKVTPHTLRHSYATHMIENGVGLRHVQDLLGHAKPETTMIYTHVAQKDLLQIQSPLDTALQSLALPDKEPHKITFSENFSR